MIVNSTKEVIKMNMPGFTAEASVYKTSERYHALVAVSHYQTDGAILPASCMGECMYDCLEGGMRGGACVRLCRSHSIGFSGRQMGAYVEGSSARDFLLLHAPWTTCRYLLWSQIILAISMA
jgi:hypothetical protein